MRKVFGAIHPLTDAMAPTDEVGGIPPDQPGKRALNLAMELLERLSEVKIRSSRLERIVALFQEAMAFVMR